MGFSARALTAAIVLGLIFALFAAVFMAQFLPLEKPLHRTFWAGLSVPITWAWASLWLFSRERFSRSAWILLSVACALLLIAIGGMQL
ncbi:hypothetical protein [uncultured Pseudoteredinibacter sp.]|uniref:hypothetical protein n=1 Tax=uncultured Pseudoteredinibacter sp. TaxID=1641701 RepID=UPI00262B8F83|nr:hypothetical protein [uncultured Pseudoteredinibacter sp.]